MVDDHTRENISHSGKRISPRRNSTKGSMFILACETNKKGLTYHMMFVSYYIIIVFC